MPEEANLDTFDYTKSTHYLLSIRLSTDGFSFFVFDPECNRFVYSRLLKLQVELSYAENMKQAFKESDFLSLTYKQVYVMIAGRRVTLIPLELFEEEHIQTLFNYNFKQKENEVIAKNILAVNSCAVLYGMEQNVRDFLIKYYPESRFVSQVAVLIEHFSLKSRAVHLKQMFACLHPGGVDLYCFDKGRISLVNTYECDSITDFSYYILLVWKQLGMNQLKDELYIAGSLPEKDELLEILRNFVQEVSELNPEEVFEQTSTSSEIKDIPYDIHTLMMQKRRTV